jgi:hypothetical protein
MPLGWLGRVVSVLCTKSAAIPADEGSGYYVIITNDLTSFLPLLCIIFIAAMVGKHASMFMHKASHVNGLQGFCCANLSASNDNNHVSCVSCVPYLGKEACMLS